MGRRIWSPDELAEIPPAQQDVLFDASIVTDLDAVPSEFLGRVRSRLERRAADAHSSQSE